MPRQTIRLSTRAGDTEIESYVSPDFPGIAVHRNPRFRKSWNTTHIESGLGISGDFRLKRLASEFAAEAGRIVDFTKTADAVKTDIVDKQTRATLRALTEKFRAK